MVLIDGEEYLTGDEAAGLLGVKRETLYAYVSRGMLKSYRQGIKRQRLYRRAEIEGLLRLAPSAVVLRRARAAAPRRSRFPSPSPGSGSRPTSLLEGGQGLLETLRLRVLRVDRPDEARPARADDRQTEPAVDRLGGTAQHAALAMGQDEAPQLRVDTHVPGRVTNPRGGGTGRHVE